jgi:hypothetical protein
MEGDSGEMVTAYGRAAAAALSYPAWSEDAISMSKLFLHYFI